MQYSTSIFVFHRDLRLHDNTGLLKALEQSEQVVPLFIATPQQLEHNKYKGDHAVQFLVESLKDLDEDLQKKGSKLYIAQGTTHEVLNDIIAQTKAQVVCSNFDYTPFAKERDAKVAEVCAASSIPFKQFHDALLVPPGTFTTKQGGVYTVFTPFMRRAREEPVAAVQSNTAKKYYTKVIERCTTDWSTLFDYSHNDNVKINGGRTVALNALRNVEELQAYKEKRDIPALDATTHLSAHHKFGTISVRETYHAVRELFDHNHSLINELYWRDFFTHIAYHFPHVFGGAFHKKYNALQWSKNEAHFEAWCQGNTGFPIIDAGMRELNTTGYMHNRVRMITASFLVKDLHIDWQKGERYFAQKLIDYDPAVNNGNWQWAASTGCDAQPYFRIFNPWLQQKKFDADCTYIKRYVPELADCTPKEIHNLASAQASMFSSYPAPIVDHKTESARAKDLYKAVA